MSKLAVPVLALCLAPAGAQAPTVHTLTNAGVFATDQNGTTLDSVKPGTKAAPLINLQTNTTSGVTASSQVQLFVTGRFVTMTVADRGRANVTGAKGKAIFGTTQSTDPKGSVVPGPYGLLLNIPALSGAKGALRVRYAGNKLSGKVFARAEVDIGNDGTVEFKQSAGAFVEKEFPVTAGPAGIQVAIKTEAGGNIVGAGSGTYEVSLVVLFIPKPGCTFTAYGKGCGGAVLKGESIPTPGGPVIFLNLSNAPKASPIVAFAGLRQLNVKIPGTTSCFILAEPLIATAFFSSSTGTARMAMGGAPANPFTAYGQAIIIDRTTSAITTTHGLRGVCR